MSSKTKTTASKEEATPALVPKRRFPEFRDGPSWTGKPMGEAYCFKSNNSLSRDQLNYEHGSVKNIHYGDIHTKFSTLFDITKERVPFINSSESLDGFRPENDCVEGDMIFADASEDLADIGKSIEIVCLNGERVVSGQHTILARPNGDSLIVGFGAYLFKSRHVRTQIQKESQGSKVLGISATRLTKIKLPLPTQPAEQQKIAECLSSVDELIAAQARKLAALKTHKKGLMQQLFPREGETQPRLRFPEFQNAGEWEEDKLIDIATFRRGSFPQPYGLPEWYDEVGGMPFVQVFDVGDNFRLKDKTKSKISKLGAEKSVFIPRGTLIVTLQGSIGRVAITHYDAYIDRTLLIFETFRKPIEKVFFARLIQNLFDIEKEIAPGGIIKTITKEALSDFKVKLPKITEQQRIADCLTSLDDLIAAQTQKLDTIKTHKKGLMQQLFPSPESC